MFDRNRFKEFVISQEHLIKKNCSIKHPEVEHHGIYKHIIWSKSFRTVKEEEFSKLKLIGSLRDPKIKRLHYVEFSNKEGEYWTENFKIATNFYPYHSSDIYQCTECNRLFVVYSESGGHAPQRRIREIKKELIVEEPSSCVVQVSKSERKKLAHYLNFNMDELTDLIHRNEKVQRIKTDFGANEIIVSELYDENFLIVGKKKLIYDLLEIFQK